MFRTLVFATAIAMVLGVHPEAWAQAQSRNMIGGGGGSVGQGISSGRMGGSSLGGMGMGGLGTGGLGSSSTGGMLQVGSAAQQLLQRGNQAGYYVGANAQNTVSSAYGNATTGRTNYGMSGYGQGTYGSGMYGNRNRTNRSRYGQYGRTGQYGMSNFGNQSQVPTRLVLGFDRPTTISAPQFSSQLTARLEKVSRIQFRSAPQVLVENGTAVLRGSVATEHDRVLAEQLVRLEAGISAVKNELTLPPDPASSPTAPEKPGSAAAPPQVPQSAPAAK